MPDFSKKKSEKNTEDVKDHRQKERSQKAVSDLTGIVDLEGPEHYAGKYQVDRDLGKNCSCFIVQNLYSHQNISCDSDDKQCHDLLSQ